MSSFFIDASFSVTSFTIVFHHKPAINVTFLFNFRGGSCNAICKPRSKADIICS
jgi:hypothetical protein